jgi:hypothetical protein
MLYDNGGMGPTRPVQRPPYQSPQQRPMQSVRPQRTREGFMNQVSMMRGEPDVEPMSYFSQQQPIQSSVSQPMAPPPMQFGMGRPMYGSGGGMQQAGGMRGYRRRPRPQYGAMPWQSQFRPPQQAPMYQPPMQLRGY